MLAHRRIRSQVGPHRVGGVLGDALCAAVDLSEARAQLADVRELLLDREQVARADRVLVHRDFALGRVVAEPLANDCELTFADLAAEMCQASRGSPLLELPALENLDRLEPSHGPHADANGPAAGRIEARPDELRLDVGPHAAEQRQVHPLEVVERRAHRVVGAAFEIQSARCIREEQRRQDRL